MTMGTDLLSVRPLDVLHLRGNRLFQGMGDGVAVMPPWPSVFSGALRSRMLADAGALHSYRDGLLGGFQPSRRQALELLASALGPSLAERSKGRFRVVFVGLERDGEVLMPAPADLVFLEATEPSGGAGPRHEAHRLRPASVPPVVVMAGPFAGRSAAKACPQGMLADASAQPSLLPLVLKTNSRKKALSGMWLTASGIRAWQEGRTPEAGDAVHASELWSYDPRLGIALDDNRRTVREGLLYTSRTVALKPGVSFVVGVTGADGVLPKDGLLRVGGDGRGADVRPFSPSGNARTPWSFLPNGKRFTLWLTTPGVFERGFLPTGCQNDGRLRVDGLTARLVAAAVPRFDVVSGWNLAEGRPKVAVRVVPAGAVYFFEVEEGDVRALAPLLARGLGAFGGDDASDGGDGRQTDRDIEGFSSFWLGTWEERHV